MSVTFDETCSFLFGRKGIVEISMTIIRYGPVWQLHLLMRNIFDIQETVSTNAIRLELLSRINDISFSKTGGSGLY